MNIIQKTPNASGAYPAPQTWSTPNIPTDYAVIPYTVDMTTFYEYNGFVVLTIEQVEGVDTVTAYVPNIPAWEAWKAEQPEPTDPEPTEEEDTASMLIDHEFRLTMLELGLSEY